MLSPYLVFDGGKVKDNLSLRLSSKVFVPCVEAPQALVLQPIPHIGPCAEPTQSGILVNCYCYSQLIKIIDLRSDYAASA